MKAKIIIYWTTTLLVALAIGSGGAAQLTRQPQSIEGMMQLGYPAYFVQLLGLWKVLGGIAILVPRFPRLKEWAYAGIFFDLTGAAVSCAAAGAQGAYAFHIIAPLVFAVLALASWYLRPESRMIGLPPFPASQSKA